MDKRFADLEDSPQYDRTIRGTLVKIGRNTELEPYPELYISEEAAILNLLDMIHSSISDSQWAWVKRPVIEKFQMTECPMGQMAHRVVQPRYAGYCEIEVVI